METLDTSRNVYDAVLSRIKKQSTGILPPIPANELINDAQIDWIDFKLGEIEKNQKRIDDLRTIRILPAPQIAADGATTFLLPDGTSVTDAITLALLPKYFRLLNVAFRITYVNNECGLTGISDWIYNVHVMRSDQRNWIMTSPHRKPSDSKIYYEIIGEHIVIETNSSSTAYRVRLEYLRPARMYFYNYINNGNTEQASPATDYTGATAGSINLEFPNKQKVEIVDRAAQIYLERIKEERYRTYLQEELIKMQNQ